MVIIFVGIAFSEWADVHIIADLWRSYGGVMSCGDLKFSTMCPDIAIVKGNIGTHFKGRMFWDDEFDFPWAISYFPNITVSQVFQEADQLD